MSKKVKEAYNEGIEKGIRIVQPIIQEEKEAIEYVKNRLGVVKDGQEKISKAIISLIEDQNEDAIKNIYNVYNENSPRDLKDYEKKILLCILASLYKDKINNNQRRYYTYLRRYLEITNFIPDMNYDFECVKQLESVKAIKIIAFAVRAFVFLETNNIDCCQKYDDILFSKFEIRGYEEIDAKIHILYSLFGEEGIVELYGQGELEDEHEDTNSKEMPKEDVTIHDLTISRGEIYTLENNNIRILDKISCSGNLVIKNCSLSIGTEDSNGKIELIDNGVLIIENSTVSCRRTEDSFFVEANNNTKVMLKEVDFYNCEFFISGLSDLSASNCNFINCLKGFIYAYNINISNSSITEDDISVFGDEYFRIREGMNPWLGTRMYSYETAISFFRSNNLRITNCEIKKINDLDYEKAFHFYRFDSPHLEISNCIITNEICPVGDFDYSPVKKMKAFVNQKPLFFETKILNCIYINSVIFCNHSEDNMQMENVFFEECIIDSDVNSNVKNSCYCHSQLCNENINQFDYSEKEKQPLHTCNMQESYKSENGLAIGIIR